jgi:hypothetical protein
VHPRLAELLRYTELQRDGLLAAVATVPETARDQRPGPGHWSVAEVLEHLCIVEQGVSRLITRRIERAREAGLGPETETGSLLHCLDRFPLLDRSATMPAPELVRPPGSLNAAAALEGLERSRHALRAAIATGDGLALGTVTGPHPLLGPLTLYQWVLFVGQHECRHAMQIRDIARHFAAA